jgi:hypothetical protein
MSFDGSSVIMNPQSIAVWVIFIVVEDQLFPNQTLGLERNKKLV